MSESNEVVAETIDADQARTLVDTIKQQRDALSASVKALWAGRGWLALGYASWGDMVVGEDMRLAPGDRDERAALVLELRAEGMSTRAIGSALGVADQTVRADLTQLRDVTQLPDTVTGLDGKERPATRPAPEVVEEHEVELIDGPDEVWLIDGEECLPIGDADLVPSPDYTPPITKPDLGGGISHPARYSDAILDRFAELLEDRPDVTILDPFAGTGRIHELMDRLPVETVGIEIELEYVAMNDRTYEGSALNLPWEDAEFDVVATSPTYGNRLADSHNASDPHLRRSYTHDLGRKLSDDNSGAMQWGDTYRDFHRQAWAEAVRVLLPGGMLLLNIKDHVRGGVQQPVAAWHVATLVGLGMEFDPVRSGGVPTQHLRQGSTTERAGQELVLVFEKVDA